MAHSSDSLEGLHGSRGGLAVGDEEHLGLLLLDRLLDLSHSEGHAGRLAKDTRVSTYGSWS